MSGKVQFCDLRRRDVLIYFPDTQSIEVWRPTGTRHHQRILKKECTPIPNQRRFREIVREMGKCVELTSTIERPSFLAGGWAIELI